MVKSTQTENRYAVCIGINTYGAGSGLSELRFAENDARSVDALLATLGFPESHRILLLGQDATLDAINDALEEYILDRPHENDLVLFYFAGHSKPLRSSDTRSTGDDGVDGEVFLTSYDFDASKIRQSRSFRSQYALGMNRLRKTFFEGEGSHKRLFIFDSCYSGDFFGPRYRDDVNPVREHIQKRLTSESKGRIALSSCLPVQKAREDEALGHGYFTYYLLKALSGEDRSACRANGDLTVGSLFDYVADRLPEDQRPVLSGVQQDSFVLVRYREYAHELKAENENKSTRHQQQEHAARLRAMFGHHSSSLMSNHLKSFVGRKKELTEIEQYIQEHMVTGGYVTLTGQAGQGKSCIMAALIDQRIQQSTEENVIYHFIPFNPSPDHQVGLLRDLLARLMLKYDPSDLYIDYVAHGNRHALKDFLLNMLKKIATMGKQEVIFIDGLDQIEEDYNGLRDLTFLPTQPPIGIVFVLATRPNDTLHPLELLKPHRQYRLPNLSRPDFDLILQHHNVSLPAELVGRFYRAMQKNALFLDLVAKELMELKNTNAAIIPEKIIQKVENNPNNLFSFYIDRLKHLPIWSIIEDILGLLLVAREPLPPHLLQQMLEPRPKEYKLREALFRLGGLLSQSAVKRQKGEQGQTRYSLFHLMFQHYLYQEDMEEGRCFFNSSEVADYHTRIARWCEGDAKREEQFNIVWQNSTDQNEQARREYTRRHYITHLYHAKKNNWQDLFIILDRGAYGRAKIKHDPSMHSYTLDIELGRRAAASPTWTLDEGIVHLTFLWRYTLLQCSITSRADNYPIEAFQLLLLLGQEAKAIGLAELLTDLPRKVEVFIKIAKHLRKKASQFAESDQLLQRANEAANDIQSKKKVLNELWQALAQDSKWEQAQEVIDQLQDDRSQVDALTNLGAMLAQAGEREWAQTVWKKAETMIGQLQDYWNQGDALTNLGLTLAQTDEREWAQAAWKNAETMIDQIQDAQSQMDTLTNLGAMLAQIGEREWAQTVWKKAETMIDQIAGQSKGDAEGQEVALANLELTEALANLGLTEALANLGLTLAQAGEWERAQTVIALIRGARSQAVAFTHFALALAQAHEQEHAQTIWKEAELAITRLKDEQNPAEALANLGLTLAQAGEWERAQTVIALIQDTQNRAVALTHLALALVQAHEQEHAQTIWKEAELAITRLKDEQIRADTLTHLGLTLIQAGKWERAQAVIAQIQNTQNRAVALTHLALALALANEQEHAQTIWKEAELAITSFQDPQDWNVDFLGLTRSQNGERKPDTTVITHIEQFRDRGDALTNLDLSLTQAREWKQTKVTTAQTQGIQSQGDALTNLGLTLIQAGKWEQAQTVISQIQGARSRGDALAHLGVALAQAGKWEQAQTVISQIQGARSQAAALTDLGMALAQAGKWEQAQTVISQIQSAPSRAAALTNLGLALAQAGKWEQAQAVWNETETVITQIEGMQSRGDALTNLGLALAQTNKWEQAQTVISQIQGARIRTDALINLGLILAQADKWEGAVAVWKEAEVTITHIQGTQSREDALNKLGLALAQAGKLELAEALIEQIQGTQSREDALNKLGLALAQAGKLELAEALIAKIQDDWGRARILNYLALVHIQAGEWEQAETVISKIADARNRGKALLQLIAALSEHHEYARGLAIVQHSWLRTATRHEALALLCIARPFILLHPELKTAFFEAFAWVDDFLKG